MSFLFETINNDLNSNLLACSILVVSLLLKQYKENAIDISDFRIHTKNKISYIISNLNIIKDDMEKNTIESLVNECIEITNCS